MIAADMSPMGATPVPAENTGQGQAFSAGVAERPLLGAAVGQPGVATAAGAAARAFQVRRDGRLLGTGDGCGASRLVAPAVWFAGCRPLLFAEARMRPAHDHDPNRSQRCWWAILNRGGESRLPNLHLFGDSFQVTPHPH